MQRGVGTNESGKRTKRAAAAILELLSISVRVHPPPLRSEKPAGLAKDERAWHLHERYACSEGTRPALCAMEVNPIQGITVQLYRVPLQPYVLCSPRSMRQ